MAVYGLVENEKIFNIIVWDGPDLSPLDFGEGITYVEIPENSGPGIGWGYVDGRFIEPPKPEPTKEEIIAFAENERQGLLYQVRQTFNVWQTKLLLNRATEEEKEILNQWLNFFDELTEMDISSAPNITWPNIPPVPEAAQ